MAGDEWMDEFEQTDEGLIYLGLSCLKCLRETGNPYLSAVDAERQGKPVKALGIDQMKSIIRLDELMRAASEKRIRVVPKKTYKNQGSVSITGGHSDNCKCGDCARF